MFYKKSSETVKTLRKCNRTAIIKKKWVVCCKKRIFFIFSRKQTFFKIIIFKEGHFLELHLFHKKSSETVKTLRISKKIYIKYFFRGGVVQKLAF